MFFRLYADNYRCLANFELPLEPLTVLLGPNGSGKSAAMLLIAKLRDFILGRESAGPTEKWPGLFSAESLTRWDTRIEQTFEIGVRLSQGDYVYRLRLRHKPERALNRVVEEKLTLDGKPLFETNEDKTYLFNDQYGGGIEFMPDWNISGISRVHERPDNTKLFAFRRFLEGTLVLALNPALVKAVSASKQPVTIPNPDCSDFADWLKSTIFEEAGVRRAMERSLAEGALPGFEGLEAPSSGDAKILKAAFSTPQQKPLSYRLDELSSGQLALIILETAFALVSKRGGALFLDEPGNFLGLSEIRPLLIRLQDAALEKRAQVVVSAHHPLAVDFLAAGYGCWLDREPSGPTRPPQRIRVFGDALEKDAHLRVSDLIARGWLSGLGVQDHGSNNTGTSTLIAK